MFPSWFHTYSELLCPLCNSNVPEHPKVHHFTNIVRAWGDYLWVYPVNHWPCGRVHLMCVLSFHLPWVGGHVLHSLLFRLPIFTNKRTNFIFHNIMGGEGGEGGGVYPVNHWPCGRVHLMCVLSFHLPWVGGHVLHSLLSRLPIFTNNEQRMYSIITWAFVTSNISYDHHLSQYICFSNDPIVRIDFKCSVVRKTRNRKKLDRLQLQATVKRFWFDLQGQHTLIRFWF